MPHLPAKRSFPEADYEAIFAAVEETARGRWFLAEHAKRNRHAETDLVLEAIGRLERMFAQRDSVDVERVRAELEEMAEMIARTKVEIAAIKHEDGGTIGQATNELDAIIETTAFATSDILSAAEHIQEIAWTLREAEADPALCEKVDRHATEIYTACSFQDLTGQRIRKVIEALRFLELRLTATIAIWRPEAVAPEQVAEAPASAPLTQDELDQNFAEPSRDRSASMATDIAPPASKQASSSLDQLTPSERLALFS